MFKFELNSVLSLKEKVEDAKKRELGVANAHKESLELHKKYLVNENIDIYNEIKKSSTREIDINAVKTFNQYASHLKKQIKQTEVHIENAQKVVDIKREELLSAMKERKILDNLKEIKLEQYTEESKKADQLLVDEMVSYKYSAVGRGNS